MLYPRPCPPLLRKRLNLYKRDPRPRWCWPDDGIDALDPTGPRRTRLQCAVLMLQVRPGVGPPGNASSVRRAPHIQAHQPLPALLLLYMRPPSRPYVATI